MLQFALTQQPSQIDLKEQVILQKEVVRVAKAPYRVPVGRAPLGGSGGIPHQKFFEIWMLKSAIWWSLGGS